VRDGEDGDLNQGSKISPDFSQFEHKKRGKKVDLITLLINLLPRFSFQSSNP